MSLSEGELSPPNAVCNWITLPGVPTQRPTVKVRGTSVPPVGATKATVPALDKACETVDEAVTFHVLGASTVTLVTVGGRTRPARARGQAHV